MNISKQKNKAFKGSKNKHQNHKTGVVKKITKLDKDYKKDQRKSIKQQQFEKKREDDDQIHSKILQQSILNQEWKEHIGQQLKYHKEAKIILLVPMNNHCNTKVLKQQIEEQLDWNKQQKEVQQQQQQEQQQQFVFEQLIRKVEKEVWIVVECGNDYSQVIDYGKVADIIVCVFNCSQTQVDKISIDPHQYSNCYSSEAYQLISELRVQGICSTIGLLMGLDQLPNNKHNQVKKLFERFYSSEFNNQSFHVINPNTNTNLQIQNLIRSINNLQLTFILWRQQRAYMLVSNVLQSQTNPQQLIVEGYLKGSYLNANQLVHITNYDDYQLHSVTILPHPFPNHSTTKNHTFIQQSDIQSQQTLDYLANLQEIQQNTQTLQQLLNNQNMDDEQQQQLNKNDNNVDDQQQQMEIDDEDDDDDLDDENNQTQEQNQAVTKQKFSLVQRNDQDLDFEDEADYANDIYLSDRFYKYQGLKNMKDGYWNPKANLPEFYANIFTYASFQQTQQQVIQQANLNAHLYPGLYVRLVINGITSQQINPQKPLIISSMFNYERKASMIHLKVKTNPEFDNVEVKSKQNLAFQIGFRKFNSSGIFSQFITKSQKTKYSKKLQNKGYMMLSLYYQTIVPPANVIIYSNLNGKDVMVGFGEFIKNDPLQIILKRKILTGYPQKINKRKAICNMMFFNCKDIKFFQPIELYTKQGLKATIVESVGTKGSMKLIFNGHVKQNDIICLPLYKRVYPKFPFLLNS